ncbi:hypothetical protein Gotur_001659 [Gossypium turneri]
MLVWSQLMRLGRLTPFPILLFLLWGRTLSFLCPVLVLMGLIMDCTPFIYPMW